MKTDRLLTIAVPSFNMEGHLPKNLPTYDDPRFAGLLEVIILDNASEDRTGEIARAFVRRSPEIFTLVSRETRGYGGSINAAMAAARGAFFRIVDADDYVDTENLWALLQKLGDCAADVVQTNYCRVVMGTGERLPFVAAGVEYGRLYTDFSPCRVNAPCIHSTVYRTALLRDCGFAMTDGIFFVDEEYVILPFLRANSVVFYDLDIYRYVVGNPTQSTSPANRAKLYTHREQIVRRLLAMLAQSEMSADAREYCFFRIAQAAGDHLTTLYMYLPDRGEGARLGKAWEKEVRAGSEEIYAAIRGKAAALRMLNRLHVGLAGYERMKKRLRRGR